MSKIPNFSLPDQTGKLHSFSDYKGRWLVVYFYPKDDTPTCTKEACSFRDAIDILTEQHIAVLGISKDSIKSHKKFADKYHLPFPLLSDESKETIKAFGAWGKKRFMGREFEGILRKTYLIDPNGEIKKVYEKIDPINQPQDVMNDITELRKLD
ncbi:MAG: thioredoxin-dependent thiol peroxidase [Candidatus Levybacteria bacterium]|nr:thioredoxin-dependent thiol peroxidase [Candidatus Levybacteria bacterium]